MRSPQKHPKGHFVSQRRFEVINVQVVGLMCNRYIGNCKIGVIFYGRAACLVSYRQCRPLITYLDYSQNALRHPSTFIDIIDFLSFAADYLKPNYCGYCCNIPPIYKSVLNAGIIGHSVFTDWIFLLFKKNRRALRADGWSRQFHVLTLQN